jgi:hypothetical protein
MNMHEFVQAIAEQPEETNKSTTASVELNSVTSEKIHAALVRLIDSTASSHLNVVLLTDPSRCANYKIYDGDTIKDVQAISQLVAGKIQGLPRRSKRIYDVTTMHVFDPRRVPQGPMKRGVITPSVTEVLVVHLVRNDDNMIAPTSDCFWCKDVVDFGRISMIAHSSPGIGNLGSEYRTAPYLSCPP